MAQQPPVRLEDEDTAAPDGAPGESDGLASVILVDRADDVAAICGRVDTAPTFAVVVHAPDGNRPLSTELGIRRLQRHADESGKVVAIATSSHSLANRARQVGIPVARKPEYVRWDAPGKRVVRLGRKSLALPAIGGLLQMVAVLAVVAAFAVLALTMAPSANVVIVPPTETLTETVTIEVSPDYNAIDLAATPFRVPATEITSTTTVTLVQKTTGKAMVGTANARAIVTITNATPADVTVPLGAVLLAGPRAIEFGIDQATVVPAGKSVTQQASALVAGVEGNIAAGTLTAWKEVAFRALTVTNAAAAAGGASEERQAVDANDITALSLLARELEKSETIRQGILEGRPHDAVFLRTAKVVATPGKPSAVAGTPADVLLLPVEVKVTALAVLGSTLEEVALKVLGAQQGVGEFVPGSVAALESGQRDLDPATNTIRTDLRVSGDFARNLTRDVVKAAVKGKSESAARSTLAARYGIQDAQVDLSPGWAPWLPRFDFRIDVTLLTRPLAGAGDNTGTGTNGTAGAAPTSSPRP